MYEQINIKQKSIFSYLYVNKQDDMNIIYDKIKDNKIVCDNEYLDKCKLIKKLFLNKIKNGMNYQTYISYKDSLKRLDPNTYSIYIDTLISILKLSDKKIMKKVYKEKIKRNYNCLTSSVKNQNIKMSPALIIDILNEIHGNMKLTVSKYVVNITKDKNKDEIKDIYNDIINDNNFYLIILKEMFIDKYSYLENSIYKELYFNFLNNLDSMLKQCIKSVLISSNRINEYQNELVGNHYLLRDKNIGYGYYKKFKDYRR